MQCYFGTPCLIAINIRVLGKYAREHKVIDSNAAVTFLMPIQLTDKATFKSDLYFLKELKMHWANSAFINGKILNNRITRIGHYQKRLLNFQMPPYRVNFKA